MAEQQTHRKTSHDATYVVTIPTDAFDAENPQLREQAEEQLSALIEADHGKSAEVTESNVSYEHVVGSHVTYTYTVKVKA